MTIQNSTILQTFGVLMFGVSQTVKLRTATARLFLVCLDNYDNTFQVIVYFCVTYLQYC